MKLKHISIFNLIEIFRTSHSKALLEINQRTHCDQNAHHDFYCDAEKPFIEIN